MDTYWLTSFADEISLSVIFHSSMSATCKTSAVLSSSLTMPEGNLETIVLATPYRKFRRCMLFKPLPSPCRDVKAAFTSRGLSRMNCWTTERRRGWGFRILCSCRRSGSQERVSRREPLFAAEARLMNHVVRRWRIIRSTSTTSRQGSSAPR